jgi:hypothetical protein
MDREFFSYKKKPVEIHPLRVGWRNLSTVEHAALLPFLPIFF